MGNELGSRYLLDEQVGRGGMGVVWKGHDRSSGAVYAIKVLHADYASDAAAVGRFIRERAALTAFRHPHVVALHDMIVEGDRLALVMDFVAGGDLGGLCKSRGGRLAAGEAARLAAQVADALAAAHAAGITHRDVKPGNVLLRDEGHALLADFGIARVASESRDTTTGMMLGTLSYLSPEVVGGQEPGPAGDVYALGVTLYELLAGQPPFTGNPAAVLHAHVSTVPEPPPAIGEDLWTLIRSCLAKAPAGRPGAAELSAALAGLAVTPSRATGGRLPAGTGGAAGGAPPAAPAPVGAAWTPSGAAPSSAMTGQPTGPFYEVTMRPLEDPGSHPTTKAKRQMPSRAAAVALTATVIAVTAVIATVVLADPFTSGAGRHTALAPTDTDAASQSGSPALAGTTRNGTPSRSPAASAIRPSGHPGTGTATNPATPASSPAASASPTPAGIPGTPNPTGATSDSPSASASPSASPAVSESVSQATASGEMTATVVWTTSTESTNLSTKTSSTFAYASFQADDTSFTENAWMERSTDGGQTWSVVSSVHAMSSNGSVSTYAYYDGPGYLARACFQFTSWSGAAVHCSTGI